MSSDLREKKNQPPALKIKSNTSWFSNHTEVALKHFAFFPHAVSLLQVLWMGAAILLNTIAPLEWNSSSHLRQLTRGDRVLVVAKRQALQTGQALSDGACLFSVQRHTHLQATLQATKTR